MKNMSLAMGAAIIVIANAFALIHVARNRMGPAVADITLTNRELFYYVRPSSQEDSGVSVSMRWSEPHYPMLNREKLQSLGFDCSVSPESDDAQRFYQRQQPRQAFIALEYDGPAWRRWLAEEDRRYSEAANRWSSSAAASRLIPIDAALDADALRRRYPDRSNVIIVPAIVGIRRNNYSSIGVNRPAAIAGYLLDLNRSIHIPRPFSDRFSRKDYSIRLRYGSLYEPWVSGVK